MAHLQGSRPTKVLPRFSAQMCARSFHRAPFPNSASPCQGRHGVFPADMGVVSSVLPQIMDGLYGPPRTSEVGEPSVKHNAIHEKILFAQCSVMV